MDLPDHFGPYRVQAQIGFGGMGAVYRAHDPRLQRAVAIKVLHRDLEVSDARERFLCEARAVSSLNHPNICTVFDVGEHCGDPYLVMELLQGEALKDRVARGPVPESDLREIAFRVALALEAAHSKGVVHRDIKPANIFLVRDDAGSEDVKVLDFGLAKVNWAPGSASDGLTREGMTVGTVGYMSPEQACGERLDARTDLFSLGVILYEMATGELPFPGATSAMVFAALLNQYPARLSWTNLNVSADLQRIIRGLLVKQRSARMQTATDLLNLLGRGAVASVSRTNGGDSKLRLAEDWRPREVLAKAPPPGSEHRQSICQPTPVLPQAKAAEGKGHAPEANADHQEEDQRSLLELRKKTESREPGDPKPVGPRSRASQAFRQQRSLASGAERQSAKSVSGRGRRRSLEPWIVVIGLLLLGTAAALWLGLHAH